MYTELKFIFNALLKYSAQNKKYLLYDLSLYGNAVKFYIQSSLLNNVQSN